MITSSSITSLLVRFFFEWYSDHRDLHVLAHSFPTRRSSDLTIGGAQQQVAMCPAVVPMQGLHCIEVIVIGAQDQIETVKILVAYLPRAQPCNIDTMAGGNGDGTLIRRLAAMPVAGTGRIESPVRVPRAQLKIGRAPV